MEVFNSRAKPSRIASNLVQGDQPVVSIKCRVLDAFRHYSGGDLLEFHRKAEDRLLVPAGIAAIDIAQKNPLNEIEEAQVRCFTYFLRGLNCFFDVLAVFFGHFRPFYISAIHRKRRDYFSQSAPQAIESEIAGIATSKSNPAKQICEDIQFAGKDYFEDESLALINDVLEVF